MCLCVCVCVCVRGRERERERFVKINKFSQNNLLHSKTNKQNNNFRREQFSKISFSANNLFCHPPLIAVFLNKFKLEKIEQASWASVNLRI